jgi:N6-adenosine-specific RNA methylase IME4
MRARVMGRLEFHPLANIFPMMTDEEVNDLGDDMLERGQREPIWKYEDKILDGRNRYNACLLKGIEPRFTEYRGSDPLGFVISLNLKRRHLSESQRAMVAAKLATMKQGARTDLASIDAMSDKQAARLLHVGEASVERAKTVQREAVAEIISAVEQGKISVSAAADVASAPAERQRNIVASLPRDADGKLTPDSKKALAPIIKEIRAEKVAAMKARRTSLEATLGAVQWALPDKKYGVIVADPEWDFQIRSDAGMLCHPSNHYPTSALDEIKARDVPSISADDCVLFLWATVPMLPQALEVMSAWGFTYVSNFAWVKDKAGTGYWNRNKHELLLVGRKGDIPAPAPGTQWLSAIDAPVGEHSEKPEKALELIESYFPTLPKIELNRRGPARAGWDAWGNEVEERDGDRGRMGRGDLPCDGTVPEAG